jgi:ADP-heptose:LPS heptosyltransferase
VDLILIKRAIRGLALAGRRARRPDALPEVAKVLLLRHDRIGDALLSTCLVDALARHRPGWQLHVLLGSENLSVLENHPGVAHRWCYDRRPWGALRLVRALRAEKFDLAVDLMNHPSLTSTVFLRLMAPRISAGFYEERRGYPFDLPVPAQPRSTVHIVRRLGELLRALGCPVPDDQLRLSYRPTAAARARAEEFLRPRRAEGLRLCGVNTSAGEPRRFWGEWNYREFLELAVREHPLDRFVVFAPPAETERARRIVEGIRGAELAPATPSFDEFAALLAGMDSVLTPDTSVVHLASAFGIPAVVLYEDENKALVWAPWGIEYRGLVSPDGHFQHIAPRAALAAWRSLQP